MEDKELFELCKQVYEKTGWEGNRTLASDTKGDEHLFVVSNDFHELGHDAWRVAYLYDTDYILEKLPRKEEISGRRCTLTMVCSVKGYYFGYTATTGMEWPFDQKSYLHSKVQGTPLKALLKLTLALHDAGELK